MPTESALPASSAAAVPGNSPSPDSHSLPVFAHSDLARLRLATEILLRLAEDDLLPAPFEAELVLFRDRVEHALLLQSGG